MGALTEDHKDALEWGRYYRNRRVLVTGHTGFKGSWLCEWLLLLGARVSGYSLEPDTEPALFRQLNLEKRLVHHIGDIRDPSGLRQTVESFRPEVIFHLAAQPLVRRSYVDPVETYETNVMGTVYLLDLLREYGDPCAAVFITSDKCYRNDGSRNRAFVEEDPMGGDDPYSSSKGCAELAIHSYRKSFFSGAGKSGVRVASARAGNVVGGGDWAVDRIVPDCIRSLSQGIPIKVRNRHAVRPWQHVLEPLRGYLMLGCSVARDSEAVTRDSEAVSPNQEPRTKNQHQTLSCFNFGPSGESCRTVEDLVTSILEEWPGRWDDATDPNAPHEAGYLSLDSELAARELGWAPVWDFERTIKGTVTWYRNSMESAAPSASEFTRAQIRGYMRDAGIPEHDQSAGSTQT